MPATPEMSVKVFAERLDIPLSSAYRLIADGLIDVINVGTGKKRPHMRITEAAYQKFLKSREIKGRRSAA